MDRKEVLPLTKRKGVVLTHDPADQDEWQRSIIADAAIPTTYGQCKALAAAIFKMATKPGDPSSPSLPVDPLPAKLKAIIEKPGRQSATTIFHYLLKGLRNPGLTEGQLRELDALVADAIPTLPLTLTSTNFTLHYTDNDPNSENNLSTEAGQQVLDKLEDARQCFVETMFRDPYVAPDSPDGKIQVVAYNIEDAFGWTSPDNGITLDSYAMDNNLLAIAEVPPHELFHRLQYAFGLYTRFDANDSDDWWIEGMAAWSGLWLSQAVTYGERITNMFVDTTTPVYDRSYNSLPIWIFLQSQIIKDNANFFAPTTFLNQYSTNVNGIAKAAFAQTVINAFKGVGTDNIDYYVNCFYMNAFDDSWRSQGICEVHDGIDLYPEILDFSADQVTAPAPTIAETQSIGASSSKTMNGQLQQASAGIYTFSFLPAAVGASAIVKTVSTDTSTFFLSLVFLKSDGSVARKWAGSDIAQAENYMSFPVSASYASVACVVTYEHSSGGTGKFALTCTTVSGGV